MELVNGQYKIGGVNALEICKEFGTPLYVYDSQKIRKSIPKIK